MLEPKSVIVKLHQKIDLKTRKKQFTKKSSGEYLLKNVSYIKILKNSSFSMGQVILSHKRIKTPENRMLK